MRVALASGTGRIQRSCGRPSLSPTASSAEPSWSQSTIRQIPGHGSSLAPVPAALTGRGTLGGLPGPRFTGVAGASGARACAPSFLDVAELEDRLVVAHSFSKSFLMTGWRLGWLVAPATMMEALGKLIEFNTSCAPVFVQRAGLAGLARADEFIPALARRLHVCRDTLVPRLAALPGVSVATPAGGMYAFFRVAGQDDSLALAKRLVVEVGLGLAPGAAFGAAAEGWLRWCFASRDPQRLVLGVERLEAALRL